MSFGGLVLTNNGRNKMAAAISEKDALKFTHIQLGDGTFNGSYSSKTELSNMVMEIPVTRVRRNDNEVLIECDWNSTQAPTAFYLREIGIVGNGVLCYYDNARSGDAEYIDPESEAVSKQKRFRFTISVTDDTEITTVINSGLYALTEDLGVVAFSGSYKDLVDKPMADDIGAISVKQLTNENLDDVKNAGFYYAAGGNTVTGKPTGVNHFGMTCLRTANGTYAQILYDSSKGIDWRRDNNGGFWSTWHQSVSTVASQGLTDTEKGNVINNIGAVNGAGDEMTGALSITGPSNAGLTVKSTNQPQTIVTRTDSNGNVLRSGMLQVSASNYFGLFDVTKNKWLCYADADGYVVLNGSANLIRTAISNPTSASTYYIPFLISNSTGNNKAVYQNDGVSLALLQGTASALGYNDLRLGNSITQGTAGNKYGQLTLCSYSSGGVKLRANTGLASFVNVYLPSSAGTLALTSNLSSYLPLAGGKMTGALTVGSNSISFQDTRVIKSNNINGIEFYRTDSSGTGYAMWINNGGNDEFTPRKDGGSILGRSNARWGQIYSTNSAISTSDRRMKHDISYIGKDSEFDTAMTDDQLEDFMMGLMACIYRLNDGTSGRPHHGFVAQDIEELMERIGLDDHAAFIKSPKTKDVEVEKEIEEKIEDPQTGEAKIVKKIAKELQHEEIPGEYIYSLRYEEFIADIIRFIQIQKNRADNLEKRIAIIEQKNLELEKRLEALEQLIK